MFNGQSKMEWIKKHKILSTIGAFTILLLIIAIANSGGSSSSNNQVAQNQPSNNVKIGQQGYLRLPGIADPTQIICLGSTQDEAKEIGKDLTIKDFVGLTQIPGAFCVGNGSQALLIDAGFIWSKVRIVKGVNKVDADKVGLAGWLPNEWVVAQ